MDANPAIDAETLFEALQSVVSTMEGGSWLAALDPDGGVALCRKIGSGLVGQSYWITALVVEGAYVDQLLTVSPDGRSSRLYSAPEPAPAAKPEIDELAIAWTRLGQDEPPADGSETLARYHLRQPVTGYQVKVSYRDLSSGFPKRRKRASVGAA